MSAQTADDLTNHQLLDAMTGMMGVITENMATKRDLQKLREEMRDELHVNLSDGLDGLREEIKADMDQLETRLTRKIDTNQASNVRHHLETRKIIGDLNRKYDHLREGLARAGEPIQT